MASTSEEPDGTIKYDDLSDYEQKAIDQLIKIKKAEGNQIDIENVINKEKNKINVPNLKEAPHDRYVKIKAKNEYGKHFGFRFLEFYEHQIDVLLQYMIEEIKKTKFKDQPIP